jgi:hypothetical protein
MLALTDSQLALLAIAATAVAPHKRAAWLGAARGQARPAADALGRDGGVRQKLAAGVRGGADRPVGGPIQNDSGLPQGPATGSVVG